MSSKSRDEIVSTQMIIKELQEFQKSPIEGMSAGLIDESNVYEWQIVLMGPTDTFYEGGIFKAVMSFPKEYPNLPPKLRFTSKMFHPNIYENGEVCISILHPPGDDQFQYETAAERWRPVHSVQSILLSVISMLSSPNAESPANLDAGKMVRDDPALYRRTVQRTVRDSQENF